MIFDLFKRIISELETRDIRYMLSGSLALNHYVVPRMTMDIDIVIELDASNIDTFLNAFDEAYYIDEETVRDEVKNRGIFNVIDHATGFKIVFIVRNESDFRRKGFERRLRHTVAGIETWTVSPEDLIISKLIWTQEIQSERQLQDIDSLLSLKNIDTDYLKDFVRV